MPGFGRHLASGLAVCVLLGVVCGTADASSVNYGDISHQNLKDLGQASTGTRLPLEVANLIAGQLRH